MGNWESKSVNEDTQESPQISRYSRLFVKPDPRSPVDDNSRTPLAVQDPLVDPRSPARENVDRTPIFEIPEPVSPSVKYKMNNDAFVDSPLSVLDKAKFVSIKEESVEDEEVKESNYTEEGNCNGSSSDSKMDAITKYIENADELTDKVDKLDLNAENEERVQKSHNIRSQSKRRRQPMLKQALFKAFEDDSNSAGNDENSCQVLDGATELDKENAPSTQVENSKPSKTRKVKNRGFTSPRPSKKFTPLVNELSPQKEISSNMNTGLKLRDENKTAVCIR